MNQVIGINDWYLFPLAARVIVFERIVGPVLFGKTPNEEAIAAALPDARLCLGELDRLLGRNEHLAGVDDSTLDGLPLPESVHERENLAALPAERLDLRRVRDDLRLAHQLVDLAPSTNDVL